MENLTEDENHTGLLCRIGLNGTHEKMFFSALNSTLSITAFLGNVLIIIALQKVSSLHSPSKLLLSCLASTDLCVGLIAQPLRAALLTSPEDFNRCYNLKAAFNYMIVILGGVSLFNNSCNKCRQASCSAAGAEIQACRYVEAREYFCCRFLDFRHGHPIITNLQRRWSHIYYRHNKISVYSVLNAICYTKIYLTLRHHQAQV